MNFIECNNDNSCFDHWVRTAHKYECSGCGSNSIVIRKVWFCAACYWKLDSKGKQYTPCPGTICVEWREKAAQDQ